MSTRLLAFDTATETLYLALVVDGRVLVRAEPGGVAASRGLLPAVQALLADGGLSLAALDAIAFGRGPGAFTGLRTACSVAQGLAVGSGKPLIALDTLAAVAECARAQGAVGPLWAAIDARMGEIYAQRWMPGAAPGLWTADAPALLYTPTTLGDAVAHDPLAIAGNALAAHPGLAASASVAYPDAVPRGAALAALALAAHDRGEWLDAAQALPLYVRDKVAQTSAERAVIRASKTA